MGIAYVVTGARRLEDGLWLAEVPPSSLRRLPGGGEGWGDRSVVQLTGAFEERGSELRFDPESVYVSHVGTSRETLFMVANQEAPKDVSPPSPMLTSMYWVTVPNDDPGMLVRAIEEGIWRIPFEYRDRVKALESGDRLILYNREHGFVLVTVQEPVERVHSGPIEVHISKPLASNRHTPFSEVGPCLLDRHGRPYRSGQAAGRGIGGRGGVLRALRQQEIECLVDTLGWEDEGIEPDE